MPIRAHLAEHAAFEPEEIQAMSSAFELACADLQIFAGDERGREIIAARIIDLAATAVSTPQRCTSASSRKLISACSRAS